MKLLFYAPLFLVMISGVAYQIGVKEISTGVDALVALAFTYLSAALAAFFVYFLQVRSEFSFKSMKINWPAFGLGASIVGMEIGNIFMYRVGWEVNSSFIVVNSFVVLALMIVGALFYGEKLQLRQGLGIFISLLGIICIING